MDLHNEKIKEKINKYTQTNNDFKILKTIKDNIHANLKALGIFKSNQNLINEVKIDENGIYKNENILIIDKFNFIHYFL